MRSSSTYPDACRGCGREFSEDDRRANGRFGCHQIAELPPISVLLIEHPPDGWAVRVVAGGLPPSFRARSRAPRSGQGCGRRSSR